MTQATATRTSHHVDSISAPLYISGFVVTWTGIAAVSSQLSNDPFTTTTMALVVLGFIFSLAARWAKLDPRIINGIPVVIGLYFVLRLFQHTFTAAAMLPIEAQQSGDMAIAVVLVWVSVMRSWMLITDTSVVFSAVTSIAMIGLVGAFNVNSDLIIYFFLYVIAALYLVIHQNYLVHRTWLGGQSSLRTDFSVLKTHIVLCIIVGLVSLLIGTVLLVPVKMIGSHLSLAAAVRFYYNPGGDSAKANVEYSDDPKFSIGGGDGYTSNDAVVMVATPSDRQIHYWRGRSYDQYTRHGWSSTLTDPVETLQPILVNRGAGDLYSYPVRRYVPVEGPPVSQIKTGSNDGSGILTTRLRIVGGQTTTLYAPSNTHEVVVSRPLFTDLQQSRDGGISFASVVDRLDYFVVSDEDDPSDEELAKSSFDKIPDSIKQRYVDLRGQDTLSPDEQAKLTDAAQSIVKGLPRSQRDVYDEAYAIQEWVAHRCLYDLNVEAVPSDKDAVSYFLFDSQRGYCDLFASSMALLCRYDGIPSRVVTGFAPGTANQEGGYDVRAKDKHAWVEVYLPNVGWYKMDPTTDATPANSENSGHSLIYYLHQIQMSLSRFFNLNGPIPMILFGVIILSLAYVVKVEVFDRLRAGWSSNRRQQVLRAGMGDDTQREAAILAARQLAAYRYRRMERAMRAIGVPRPRQLTPGAYLAVLRSRIGAAVAGKLPVAPDDIIGAAVKITDDYIAAAYAPAAECHFLLDESSTIEADGAADLMDQVARKNWYQGWRTAPKPRRA